MIGAQGQGLRGGGFGTKDFEPRTFGRTRPCLFQSEIQFPTSFVGVIHCWSV